MEDNYTLTWEDSSAVVQGEEVICSIENEILPGESEEFTGVCDEQTVVEETVQNDLVEGVPQDNIVYLTDDNVLVMHSSEQDVATFQEQFVECQVAEEVVTEQWDESCPEEIIVGSEEAIGGEAEEQISEDFDIPLPMDQDDYLHQRPYPCDFCSRRFRKKANLMNHMVAHQTDRPHGCNLCGVRYIRKCDLMNHLKIHAYVPETDGLEEDDIQPLDESDIERPMRGKRAKIMSNGRKKNSSRIKREYETEDENVASSSKSYSYVDEDMRLMEAMENNVKGSGGGGGDSFTEYQDYVTENHTAEIRYPITDPRKPFVCQHCGVCFAREKALASHSRVHAGDSPFECQKCSDMFWDVAKLREHVRTKHGGDIEDYDDDDEDEDYSEEEQKYGTFYCATCGLSFHRQDNLKRHQRVHIKEEYSLSEQEIGHVCNVCGDSFPEALELLAHAEIHARTTSDYRCMICGEPCTDEQAVAAHVQAKHGKNLPPNTCMLCGRTCKDRRTLLKHSWEHSKEKSFACSKCAKTFHNKARLKRHMLSHRNKMVSCDVCGEEFPDGRSLLNHRHSHNSMSARQFPCRECGKTFGSRSSQQIHIRIHTGERPYGCRFCWKAFADGGTLRKHERIHTGEKPYACAVCPRAFNQRVVLREHIRSHHSGPDPKYTHSVTPYCCSVCSDMFATSQDLIVHLIVHCDQNTAMKRQPQVHPRKYKRRRKLKPHELEMISNKIEDDVEDEEEQHNVYSDSEEDRELRKRTQNKRGAGRKSGSPKPSLNDTYTDLYNSCSSALENISSIVNSKSKSKKKQVKAEASVPSRPKMIHTQKTRVPVETGEDGKVRHKTRTMVTRTQPTELKSATGERIRPRTKNVSYHILNSEKLPVATFPEDDTEQAVSNLLKDDSYNTVYLDHHDGVEQHPPTEVAVEHVIQTENEPVPTNIIKVSQSSPHNLRRGTRHIAGSKVVRLVKGGMIITKNKEKQDPENILPDIQEVREVSVKQEVVDASPLHELAELSMQHAQNIFRCEMCSATFQDRNKLLDHVPVHI